MTKTSIFTLSASAALMLAVAASAQQQNQSPSGNIFEQLLGNVFGNNSQQPEQAIESEWSQGARPFEQRRAQLDARIDAAVRDGAMTRGDADTMRREYNDIVRLEAQYTANGPMQPQQRNDLRTRYRALTQRFGGQNYGQSVSQYGDGQWQSAAQQNNLFEQRLTERVRNRSMTQTEANQLRGAWRSLLQIERQYQGGGFDQREQTELWSRYNAIDARLGGTMAGGFGGDGNTQRWRQMETRLVAAQRAGRLNAAQVMQMRSQMGDLERLDAAYARTGYSAEQRTYLARRYGELDVAMRYNRR